MNERMTIRSVSAAVGAEILDLDLAGSLPESIIDEIRRALFQHGVVFFRDQKLTPEQHVAFAQRFGEINVNRFFKAVDGYPMIAEVRKEPEQKGNIGGNWHTDHSYDSEPAMARSCWRASCRRRAATRCLPTCIAPSRRYHPACSALWKA